MNEWFLRFLIGGCTVSVFAELGALFRPKSFAGLFSAAPSVALATLGLAFANQGASYARMEAQAMMLGALALVLYCFVVCQLLARFQVSALLSTAVAIPLWVIAAFGLKFLILS